MTTSAEPRPQDRPKQHESLAEGLMAIEDRLRKGRPKKALGRLAHLKVALMLYEGEDQDSYLEEQEQLEHVAKAFLQEGYLDAEDGDSPVEFTPEMTKLLAMGLLSMAGRDEKLWYSLGSEKRQNYMKLGSQALHLLALGDEDGSLAQITQGLLGDEVSSEKRVEILNKYLYRPQED